MSPALPAIDRFSRLYVVDPGGCWIWAGASGGNNPYGRFWDGRRMVGAHRWSWQWHTGSRIPGGYDVHHRCGEERCVNWRHLEPCLPSRNQGYRAVRACSRLEHRRAVRRRGRRYCLDCHADYMRAWRLRRRPISR